MDHFAITRATPPAVSEPDGEPKLTRLEFPVALVRYAIDNSRFRLRKEEIARVHLYPLQAGIAHVAQRNARIVFHRRDLITALTMHGVWIAQQL